MRGARRENRRRLLLTMGLGLVFGGLTVRSADADEETPAEQTPVRGVLSGLFPELSSLHEAHRIEINDNWDGLNRAAPFGAFYALDRVNDQFAGLARFIAGGNWRARRTVTTDVAVPLDDAQAFLQRLADVQVEEGDYQPRISRTDDYPSISIRVMGAVGTLQFFTRSQGHGHIPWGVAFANRIFVVHTDEVAGAYRQLDPYLKRDVLRQLIRDVETDPSGTPAAS